jgi:uncharacterized cupin superfamily protein
MTPPPLVFSHTAVDLKAAPIPADWVRDGAPHARNGVVSVSKDRLATTLVWDCTAGAFNWIYDTDETIHILEGGVVVTAQDGTVRELGPGDVVFFPAGSSAHWRIATYVRKLAFFRQPAPTPIAIVLKAMHKAMQALRAQTRSSGARQIKPNTTGGLQTALTL